MTAESRDRSHNGNWVERRSKEKSQEGEPGRGTKKRNQEEEPERGTKKKKTTRQYRGKTDTGGWEDSSLTLRMTAESRDRSQNDSWVER